jgi:hypothetical protein
MRSRTVKRLLLSLLGFAVMSGAITAAIAVAPDKAGITVQIAPASQSVTRGQTANYTVTVTSTGGFTGSVALAATGMPSGASATFAPASLSLTNGASGTSNLAVATSSSATVGSFTFTVTGSSGKVSGSVTAGLTVNYPISSSLAMTATPSSVSMNPGATAVYTAQLTRTNLAGPVTFGLVGGLPSGATASYSPNPTTGNSSTLQITTSSSTPTGTYSLNLVASGQDAGGATRYAYANVSMEITSKGKDFTISGNVSGLLAPGVSQPLNLTLVNPNNQTLSITNLTVTVQSVAKKAGAPAGPCSTADYAVTQYSGPYPLSVPANGSASLSGLQVAQAKWPQVRMLDSATNQDGCKGASVTLSYSGAGQGA